MRLDSKIGEDDDSLGINAFVVFAKHRDVCGRAVVERPRSDRDQFGWKCP